MKPQGGLYGRRGEEQTKRIREGFVSAEVIFWAEDAVCGSGGVALGFESPARLRELTAAEREGLVPPDSCSTLLSCDSVPENKRKGRQ